MEAQLMTLIAAAALKLADTATELSIAATQNGPNRVLGAAPLLTQPMADLQALVAVLAQVRR